MSAPKDVDTRDLDSGGLLLVANILIELNKDSENDGMRQTNRGSGVD